jgi:hypothetical protein
MLRMRYTQASAGGRLIDPSAGTARRRAEKAAVLGASQLDCRGKVINQAQTVLAEVKQAPRRRTHYGRSDAIAGGHGSERSAK